MFTQILMVTNQTKSVEYWLYLMICLLISLVMKKLKQIVTEFFICGGKLNIAFAFIKESYFSIPKNFILNSTHCYIMKTPNKRELQKNLHLIIKMILDLMILWKYLKVVLLKNIRF